MAYLGITATRDGFVAADGGDLDGRLDRLAGALPPDAPVVVLIHGYKFRPGRGGRPGEDPHRSLYAFAPDAPCWKVRSWPQGLGFDPEDPATGLCVGFGWPAAEAHLPALIAEGRTGFARVYDRAAAIGATLAALIARLQAALPGREIDVLAHSLGARVALAALPHLEAAPGRMLLLGAAEFDARAREALDACRAPRPPAIYNVTARANDIYDAAFETFAPRRSWQERAVGLGLGDPPPCWLDLQIDRAEVTDWIVAQGVPLTPARARFCHWSFYIRDGAFDLYRAILRRVPGWDVAALRVVPALAAQEPRWSRVALRPKLPSTSWIWPAADGAGLGRA